MRSPQRSILINILLLTALACSFGGLLPSEEAITDLTGPILGLNVASALDEQGQLADPGFTFPPDQPQITIVVDVGEASSTSLDITWYRVPDEGEPEQLFTHTVEVATSDRAYSVGQNPGTLAEGTYRVIVTMDSQTQEIEFDVAAEGAAAETTANISEAASSGPPTAGPSGSVTQAAPAVDPENDPISRVPGVGPYHPGVLVSVGDDVWSDKPRDLVADYVEVTINFGVFGPAPGPTTPLPEFRVEVEAYVNGMKLGTKKYNYTASSPWLNSTAVRIDPCDPGFGPDLPGAPVRVVGSVIVGGKKYVTSDVTAILGDDTLAPQVRVISDVKRGTRVKPGQKIELTVRAEEKSSGGPWQTGVQSIQVFANDELLNKEGEGDYSAFRHKACGQKSWEQTLKITYVVPENPDAEIELCAVAEDFVGNASKDKDDCGTFYAGEVWEGTMKSQTSSDYGQGYTCSSEYDTVLKLIVAEDGSISGEGQMQAVSYECTFDNNTGGAGPVESATVTVQGKAYADRLQISLFIGPVVNPAGAWRDGNANIGLLIMLGPSRDQIIPITAPGIAKGQFSTDGGTGGTHTLVNTFELRCMTCEPEPVSLLQPAVAGNAP